MRITDASGALPEGALCKDEQSTIIFFSSRPTSKSGCRLQTAADSAGNPPGCAWVAATKDFLRGALALPYKILLSLSPDEALELREPIWALRLQDSGETW
jgi:hypothetical protein